MEFEIDAVSDDATLNTKKMDDNPVLAITVVRARMKSLTQPPIPRGKCTVV